MTKKKTDEAGNPPSGMSFEKALARLETIVGDMEAGELSLEQMMARFEEGQALVKHCTQKLNEVERRIELLVNREGAAATEPFAPPADEDAADSGEEPPSPETG